MHTIESPNHLHHLVIFLLAVIPAWTVAAEGDPPAAAKTPAECVELIQQRYLKERRAGVAGIAALDDAAKAAVVADLLPLLDADDWQTQLHAAGALQEIGPLAVSRVPDLLTLMKTALSHKDTGKFDLLGRTVARLKGRDPDQLKAMFTMMKTAMAEGNAAQYDKLSATLGAEGKEAVPVLVAMVRESEGMLRQQAVSALAGLGKQASAAVGDLLEVGTAADAAMQRHIQDAIVKIKAENRPPAIAAVTAGCNEGKSTEIELPMTDADDLPLVLKAEIAEQPRHGTLERKSARVFVYTSKPGFKGADVFKWQGADGQGKSEPATCTVDVHPDTVGPRIVAVAGAGAAKLRVVFDEEVTAASANRAEAWSVDQGVTVSAAALAEDGKSVILETSALADGTAYAVAAKGIADRSEAGNTADPSGTCTYSARPLGLVDSDIAGDWQDAFGGAGYEIHGDEKRLPTDIAVAFNGFQTHTWAGTTEDKRALKRATKDGRLAACWFNGATGTITITGRGEARTVSLYFVDWDKLKRSAIVECHAGTAPTDASRVGDPVTLRDYSAGAWVTVPLSDKATTIVLRNTGPHNVTLCGIFFNHD